MPIATPNFRKWQAAELAAQAVEGEIRQRLLAAPRDALPDLHDELVLAGALRHKAHALFQDAMVELEIIASTLERRALDAYSIDARGSASPGKLG